MGFTPADDLFQIADWVERVDLVREGQIYARRVRAIRRRPSHAERAAFPGLATDSLVWLLCGPDIDGAPAAVDQIHTPRGVFDIFAIASEAQATRWRCLADVAENQQTKSTGL